MVSYKSLRPMAFAIIGTSASMNLYGNIRQETLPRRDVIAETKTYNDCNKLKEFGLGLPFLSLIPAGIYRHKRTSDDSTKKMNDLEEIFE